LRVLSVVRLGYYGSSNAVEPVSLYFTIPLRDMGHEVEIFDHYDANRNLSRSARTELLVRKIRSGSFDLVLYQTAGTEPIETEALADLSKRFCIVAWNSDDDWQWHATSRIARHFTFMITTYPHIYEANRMKHSNLLLSQWACLGTFSDYSRAKDIDFSFAGAVYKTRNSACRYLRRTAGLRCFGRGSRLVNHGIPYVRGMYKIPWLIGQPVHFKQINEIWNRSRVSYCPMAGGPTGEVFSLKSRVFDMGASGTLVLCEHSPNLERYYTPAKECVTFDNLEDCAAKAKWYLAHEAERARISANYRQRTLKEHLWKHRFAEMFQQIGLPSHSSNYTLLSECR
jgi:Glycosyl transferases group 1